MVWETRTMWVMPAALELRGKQKVPLQVFVVTCSGTAAYAVQKVPWPRGEGT